MKTVYVNPKKELTKKKMAKISKKLYKLNKKGDIAVAISNNIIGKEELCSLIYDYGIKILDGKWLFKFMIYDIIEYISEEENRKIETLKIALLMDNIDDVVISQIANIAKEIRSLKIMTSMVNSFSYLENELYEKYGIAIQITNNKSKGLSAVDLIINLDFDEEKILKYDINTFATIINIGKSVETLPENFLGKNINNYEIEYSKENYEEKKDELDFDSNILYESYIYRKDNFMNIYKQLKLDNVRLVNLK